MKSKTNIFRFIRNLFQEKCPKCKEGDVFKRDTGVLSIPDMNHSCSSCNYRFEREPGYFIGAMYLSYGLAAAQGITVYVLLSLFFPSLYVGWILSSLVLTFLLFAKKNFKWSRILYIYIFPW